MADSTYSKVTAQFSPVAANYATSLGHNNPNALSELVKLAEVKPTHRVLDVGTGAGNTAFAFAPLVKSVVALDLTQAMLDQVEARKGDLSNVETQLAPAEQLPFEDETFDVVVCRLCAHHFADVTASMSEMSRVLVSGGRLILQDTIAPEDDVLDRQINEIEVLRDPSHVRNYKTSEWVRMVSNSGLKVEITQSHMYTDQGSPMEFESWIKRIGTHADSIPVLRDLLVNASDDLKATMNILITDGRIEFGLPLLTLVADKSR